jgi:hypothetical protein
MGPNQGLASKSLLLRACTLAQMCWLEFVVASHKQESNHLWWFSCKSGSSVGLIGLVVMCHPPMCHLVEDWFEQN